MGRRKSTKKTPSETSPRDLEIGVPDQSAELVVIRTSPQVARKKFKLLIGSKMKILYVNPLKEPMKWCPYFGLVIKH